MPTNMIKKDAREGKGTVKSLEKKWDKAKDAAGKKDGKQNWALTNYIYQRQTKGNIMPELNAATRLLATETQAEAINTVANIFKKAGKRASTRLSKRSLANLQVGPLGKGDFLDILYKAGFRFTKTSYTGGTVVRRGPILVASYTAEEDKMTPMTVHILSPEEVEKKDAQDAEWGASYKGMKFAKWES